MTEFRRLRTQAERSGEAWRQVADTRPGYATYDVTPAGDPSWLRRANPSLGIPVKPEVIARVLDDVPAPVDGETCKQWCGYCHLGSEQSPTIPQQPPADRSWIEMTDTPPRRRWWHRYTRRNP